MKRLLLALLAVFSMHFSQAQLLTWTPAFPTEANSGQSLAITVDATLGNQGLLNHTPTDVYVHIGVITNLSTGPTDWKYSKFTWGTPDAAAKAMPAGTNKWTYTINGSLRSFFGITNASETIQKIAILFRSSTATSSTIKKQANTDGSDMYIPVYTAGAFNVRLDKPNRQPNYAMTPDAVNWNTGTTFTATANASTASDLKLSLISGGGAPTQLGAANGVTTLSANGTVSSLGLQTIIAEATSGTTTVTDTIKIFVGPTASPTAALPAGMVDGINYGSDPTRVTLVLRAPNKTKVTVIGDFNNWLEDLNYVMNKTPDGKFFWITLNGLTPGQQYGFQYKVDDALRIADPYSTLVLDPYNDQYVNQGYTVYPNMKAYPTGLTTEVVGVLQTAAPAYNWSSTSYTRPNKGNLITYELLVRDFLANHDWKTLTDTLNYLKNLGVNTIELLPFNEFEGNNSWGYNPDFYFSPDKYYGPANELKRFIDSCHGRGIAVIQDIALNHSFGMSPMVRLYWDAANNRPAANNPWFNPTARHPYNVGYDMNHESPDTKYFVSRVLDFWLNTYKVDGFRFDLSKGFTQRQTNDVGAWSNYDQSRVDIWKAYYDTMMLKSPGSIPILEHFADNSEDRVLADYGFLMWGNMAYNYQQAAMGYTNSGADLSYGLFTQRNFANPHLVTYAESHDEERLMYKMKSFGVVNGSYNVTNLNTALKRMELVGAFLFTQPGPKMFWQFGELGYDYAKGYCMSTNTVNGCDVDPKPIKWDYLAVPERKAVYNVWSKVLNLRNHPWYKANFTSSNMAYQLNGDFRWFKSTTDTSNLLVVGNWGTGTNSGTVTFQNAGTWYDLIDGTTYTATGGAQNMTLAPGEYHIYTNRNTSNPGNTPVQNLATGGNSLDAGVYPNPVGGSAFQVDLYLPAAGNTSFELLTATGQQLRTLRQGYLPRGRQLLSLNRAGVPAGAYFLRISSKNGNRVLPIILQ